MKDEEMAEEWVRTKHNILKDCLSECVRAEHKNEIQAFLAGLKAGRPQWHDLRENPNDLPNNRRNVWITYINGYGQKETTRASFRYKYWVISGHRTECEVIAWCEIPTFEEDTDGDWVVRDKEPL